MEARYGIIRPTAEHMALLSSKQPMVNGLQPAMRDALLREAITYRPVRRLMMGAAVLMLLIIIIGLGFLLMLLTAGESVSLSAGVFFLVFIIPILEAARWLGIRMQIGRLRQLLQERGLLGTDFAR